tara:strand:+ start:554 stop:967 length:414 start_codon:yes stop_codon:yes gene_type:complete
MEKITQRPTPRHIQRPTPRHIQRPTPRHTQTIIEDSNNYLKKWEIICGGITFNIKENIIKNQIKNKQIDKRIIDLNTIIYSIITEIERYEHSNIIHKNKTYEENREKDTDKMKSYISKLQLLLNEKQVLIKKKEEIL